MAMYVYLSWDTHSSMHNQKDFFQMQGRILKKATAYYKQSAESYRTAASAL